MTIQALSIVYPWTKALHVMSLIAWMAATFYMPRLFVYHTECGPAAPRASVSR